MLHYNNEKSPDLFADDDDDGDDEEGTAASRRNGDEQDKENNEYLNRSYQRISGVGAKEGDLEDETSTDRIDRMLLKRMQMSLAGIPPPPALTYSDIDVGTMLTIYRSNAESWFKRNGLTKNDNAGDSESDNKQQQQQEQQCLTKPSHSIEELANVNWPELKKHRAHGLHYNRMLNQSPGRRLSHLARRRATFSSESLLNTSGSKSGTIVSASKTAINAGVLRRMNPHRVCNNRQVLLDPNTTTHTMTSKRRRSSITDDKGEENAFGERTEKIRRTESTGLTEEDLTPRSLKFARSKSFCVGLQSTTQPATGSSDCAPGIGGKTLIRANSEISSADGPRPLLMLTENHKKKLLWAVSQALQSKQITAKHELFKQHASNLVRVVKRLFLEFNDQTTSSTSEKLLKLANKHVYEVIQGKSVDDI
uniref:Uncharacterized protein n=1 Tax=Anopheles culicifacies TaxID=139723 RepID=A0A182M8G8_9DIPT